MEVGMMAALRMYEHDILRQERLARKDFYGVAYICASAAHLRAPVNEGGAASRPTKARALPLCSAWRCSV